MGWAQPWPAPLLFVQFNARQRGQRQRVAEEEVDVFLVDPVGGDAPALAPCLEAVAQATVGTDYGPAGRRREQGPVEIELGRAEKIVAQVVGLAAHGR